eukprot:SAG31_NODE_3649_length_4028_cov_2.261644_3_plen_84_part_00
MKTSSCPSPNVPDATRAAESGCCQHHKTQSQEESTGTKEADSSFFSIKVGTKSVRSAEASAPHSRDRQLRRRRRLGTITGYVA